MLYNSNSIITTTPSSLIQEIHKVMGATYTCGYTLQNGNDDDQVTTTKFCQYFSNKCRLSKYKSNFPPEDVATVLVEPNSAEAARIRCQ